MMRYVFQLFFWIILIFTIFILIFVNILYLHQIAEGETVLHEEKTVDMLGMMFSEGKDDMDEIVKICNGENEAVAEKYD